jgi:uncharacterized protein with NRDE domain
MCLLIALTRLQPSFPLVVGANRDELYERPAVPMTVLRQSGGPPVLGGRDELAGGTWLAVNEAGVLAGVTNSPSSAGRDPTKRSRGELPLLLAEHRSAGSAVDHFLKSVDPLDYNPAWILVGDRQSLFAIDMADGSSIRTESLPPGLHVLENRPLRAPSPKVRRAHELLGDVGHMSVEEIERRLEGILSDHEFPVPSEATGEPARPPEVDAACVHTERYGTRWSAIAMVPAAPADPPRFRYTEDAPCRSAYRDARSLWNHETSGKRNRGAQG